MAKAKKSKAELQADLSAGKSISEIASESETVTTETAPAAPVTAEQKKEKGPGKIAQILAHFKSGKTTKEISALPFLDENGSPVVTGKDENGNEIFETFHPTTISIQVNKFKKMNPDIYPPLPPAPTKKEIAEQKKAEKAAAAALAAANAPQPQTEASAVASDGTPA
jgi:hypothetical protein